MKTTRLLTLFTALILALSAYAYDFKSGDLYYNITSYFEPYTVEVTYQTQYYSGNYSGLTTVAIPSTVSNGGITYSVTSIGDYAIYACDGLTSITIPESVTSIGMGAFEYCSGLTSITIPNGVTTIKNDTFSDCSSLASVVIPESVTSIGQSAFFNTGLTTLVIPSSVTTMEDYAFGYCLALTSITVNATTPPTIYDDSFFFIDRNIPLYVPAGTLGVYQAHTYWGEFINASVNTATVIKQVNLNESVSVQNGSIVVATDANLPVTIYDFVGRLVVSGLSSTQHFEVPNAGVYIVKVGDQTMKVLVP